MATPIAAPACNKFYDRARFYSIGGRRLPSVTTILGIIDKSGPLMGWAVKEERKAFEAAMLDLVTSGVHLTPDNVLEAVGKAVAGARAAAKLTQKAADIGTAAHALIAWECERMMGKKGLVRPANVPDAAELCLMGWQDWAKSVAFEPLAIEHTVFHPEHRYAGTLDFIARITTGGTRRKVLGDYKTGKAIYPESFLQNKAYRECAAREHGPLDGIIVRLPKTLEDLEAMAPLVIEAMPVPDVDFADFLAAFRLWRWQRRCSGLPVD